MRMIDLHSIRGKLTGVIMVTSTAAVLLSGLGFVASDLVSLRHQTASDLSTLAEVVGSNSTAALTFGDKDAATEVLDALRAKKSIVAAVIYGDKGEIFARYDPDPAIGVPKSPNPDGFRNEGGRLQLTSGIRLDEKRIGTLYIVTDASDRNALLKQYGLISAGIVLVSLIAAFALSEILQRGISGPIVELAKVASLVSSSKKFNVRARESGSRDEIGSLVSGFNAMLSELEHRDDRLLLHQTHLEETVARRTLELTAANAELLLAKDQAEKAAETNARLARESALILNSATDGILGLDLDGKPSFLNPAGCRILGRTLWALTGQSLHEIVHPSPSEEAGTHSGADCPLDQAIARGESFSVTDDAFWKPDGSSFPVEYSSTPMLGEDGHRQGAVLLFRDVTERRVVERLKGEFVATVSHELRTPLTSIRGALGLLSSGLLGPVAEKGRRMLEIAVTNTDRLIRLINDILDLERIDSGQVELAYGPVAAGAALTQAGESLQTMADEAGVRVTIEPVMASLWGDSDRIIQTLTNLLGNAIKFSPPETTVTMRGLVNDQQLEFQVSDEGRGIPADKLSSIFDRFSQVDASDSRQKGGSGLGLAICQSIVRAHGGRIWVEANEPVGTRFCFTIPLAPAMPLTTPAEEEKEGDNASPSEHKASVLIVEDDVDLAGVMAAALQTHGLRTFHAGTGREAVRLALHHQPDLIVLDLILRDIDGFAVVSELRASPNRGAPLLVYSALDVRSADQPRLRLGPTEFLTKSRCTLLEFEGHVVRILKGVTGKEQRDVE